MTTPFETFVNGELPKRVSTEDSPLSWTNGQVLTATGVGLAVEAVDANTLGFEPSITGSGVATEFLNGNKVFTSVTATSIGAIPTSEKGAADGVATLDTDGKIPLSQIPAAAVERVVIVADETARFALTTATVQQGDVVDQQTPKAIYFVVDDAELDNAAGYSELVAGTAAAVAWSGVTGIPVIISDIAAVSGSVDGDVLQKVSGTWVNRTTAQLKTSLAIETSDVSGLSTTLGLKADLANPTFTGTVTVPTATAGDSSTAAASTAFVAGEISANAQPKDATLTALAAYNTDGIIVQTAADTFTGRSLAAGQGITILNPSAVAANPTISITDTAVTPGTYGSAAKIPTITTDSMGRITSASEVDNGVFSDSVFRIQDNGDATKQLAFETSGIATGTTKTITMLNTNVTLGRTITGTASQVTVTNGDGVSGNPTISLAASGVSAGTYGSSTQYPIVTVNTKGIVTGITLQTVAPASAPAYAAGVAYVVGELVHHQNHTWRVLVAHTGAIPFVNGNLELVGDVFQLFQLSTPYVAQRLGVKSPSLNMVDKTLDVTFYVNGASTIDISEAPARVTVRNGTVNSAKTLTITKTHATDSVVFLDDTGTNINTTSGLTATYVITLGAGQEVELLNLSYNVVVKLRNQNTVGRFKLCDNSSTLDADKDDGWLFAGAATAARTITLPNANVDLSLVPASYSAGSSLRVQGGPSSTGAENTIIGGGIAYIAGQYLTTATANTIIGASAGAGLAATLSNNTLVGKNAGYSASSGEVTAIGMQAGYSAGAGHTSVGYLAGRSSGANTTAVGHNSGPIGSSTNTTCVGFEAGYYVSTNSGGSFTAIGSRAGRNNTASDWVAVGYEAGGGAPTGSGVYTSIGYVAIGKNALNYNISHYTIAIGQEAGTNPTNNPTGDTDNIFLGRNSGRLEAISGATAINRSLAIGYDAKVSTSNTFILGSASLSINVGICMTTATARLHLPAGTAAAGSAPLKFTSGTLLTTPESGVLEYDGTHYYGTLSGVRQQFAVVSELRYSENAQVGTTYTITSSDVMYHGNVYVTLTNAADIAVTLDTPTVLGKVAGDSVTIVQGGEGIVTVTAGTLVGAKTSGTTAVFTREGEAKTFVAANSTTWRVFGG